MKVKTGLQIGAVFPVLLAIFASLSMVVRSQEARKALKPCAQVESLLTAVTKLNMATHRLAMHLGEAEALEWENADKQVKEIIAVMRSSDVILQNMTDRVNDGHALIEDAFIKLSATIPDGSSATELNATQQRLAAEMVSAINSVTVKLYTLNKYVQGRAVNAQRERDTVAAALFGVMALVMAGGVLVAGRRIMMRFENLHKGIGAVTAGNFDNQLPVGGNDEIDKLADAFNHMSRELKKSHKALRKEALEHQQAAEALRKANVTLSDALSKLKRAQKQVIDSERLNALSQMAGGIAHDFNNTLTPILGLSDYILAYPHSLDDKKTTLGQVATINEAVKKARQEIRRLGDFFVPVKHTDFEPVDLSGVIRRAVQFTRPLWKDQSESRGVYFDVQANLAELPMIDGNAADLQEVFAELIRNAVEAMHKGGTITISTKREGNMVVAKLFDEGEGMSEEVCRRCYEPFFSTKGDTATGMGLTVAAGIIRQHKGAVDINSTPGSGTVVTIRLPFGGERSRPRELLAADEEHTPPVRVLVIDDEPWVRQVLEKTLQAEGHSVALAEDGPEGLEAFRKGEFDVVIVDRAMPKMHGDALVAAIKTEKPATGVILLTGFGDMMKDRQEHPEGVDVILSKPAGIDELRKAMAKVVRRVRGDAPTAGAVPGKT